MVNTHCTNLRDQRANPVPSSYLRCLDLHCFHLLHGHSREHLLYQPATSVPSLTALRVADLLPHRSFYLGPNSIHDRSKDSENVRSQGQESLACYRLHEVGEEG